MTRLLIPAVAGALFTACGYVAGPLPPLANIPAKVADLAALQRGSTLIVYFTVPTKTTEGITLPVPPKVDLRIGPSPSPFNADRWAAEAEALPPPKPVNGVAAYHVPVTRWVGNEVTVGARVIGSNGKNAGWSDWINLPIVAPPAQPTNFRYEVTPAGLRLTWQAAGEHFRVYRRAGDVQQYDVVAPTLTEPQWTDPNITFGTTYHYLAQTFVPLGNNREAQSELSEPLVITPEAPPPPAPTGLHAVPAPNSIELSWDGNPDPEITGYRIYRGEPGGPLQMVGEAGAIPAYSDHTVQHARNYRYAVTALTRSGRESPQSVPVDLALP